MEAALRQPVGEHREVLHGPDLRLPLRADAERSQRTHDAAQPLVRGALPFRPGRELHRARLGTQRAGQKRLACRIGRPAPRHALRVERCSFGQPEPDPPGDPRENRQETAAQRPVRQSGGVVSARAQAPGRPPETARPPIRTALVEDVHLRGARHRLRHVAGARGDEDVHLGEAVGQRVDQRRAEHGVAEERRLHDQDPAGEQGHASSGLASSMSMTGMSSSTR